MNKSLKIFLQAGIVFIGFATLTFMLWEPHLEGRNAQATVYQIYFNDPFLAYGYLTSIPFFVVLYQAFSLLNDMGEGKITNSLNAFRTIKYCASSLICLISVPLIYLFIARPGDDIAGGVAIGLFLLFVSILIGVGANWGERTFKNSF